MHRVLVDIVSAAANATPGLGRYPHCKREVVTTLCCKCCNMQWLEQKKILILLLETFFLCFIKVIAIASDALDGFKSEAKKMVVALVDMERAFVPPQHFIRLVQRR